MNYARDRYIISADNVVVRLRAQYNYIETMGDDCPEEVSERAHRELIEALEELYDEIPKDIRNGIRGYEMKFKGEYAFVIPN